MGLSRTVSEVNGDFGQKSYFFPARVLNAPAKAVPVELCNDGRNLKKTRVMPLLAGGKSDDMCIYLNTT